MMTDTKPSSYTQELLDLWSRFSHSVSRLGHRVHI